MNDIVCRFCAASCARLNVALNGCCDAQWLSAVASVAPTMPLYYYHIAIMTGVNFRMDQLLEAIHDRIPSFRGLKYSDADLHIYGNCVAFQDGLYDVLYGKDEVMCLCAVWRGSCLLLVFTGAWVRFAPQQFLGALAMGGRGAVGSTYNYMGATYVRMMAAFRRGDMAAALVEQRRSQVVLYLVVLLRLLSRGRLVLFGGSVQGVDLLLASSTYGTGTNIGKAILELKVTRRWCCCVVVARSMEV